ncbi:hypothetical protein [Acinetobacter sp. G18]|uniref:hypothetical protein n=1 Tax=Acinetobacter sp. G18 TaxID=2952152 RepID=UPI004044E098
MKQAFENVKLNRPALGDKEKNMVMDLADSILGHVIPHFNNTENTETSDVFLLNEHPILKFCAILEAQRVIFRSGLNMEVWIDEATQIPTLNYRVIRNLISDRII